ncbi:hypothetical protein EVAR_28516_1 [Eumeta japonica]|uniref:Uncharacterized protein n=1 Tax=Eumeta variegata TaxID=151549 RepID=A0A4C1WSU1_EUMVA|nr:hypothetical protein EVAR_28516_1 [Eumeta japonica]
MKLKNIESGKFYDRADEAIASQRYTSRELHLAPLKGHFLTLFVLEIRHGDDPRPAGALGQCTGMKVIACDMYMNLLSRQINWIAWEPVFKFAIQL